MTIDGKRLWKHHMKNGYPFAILECQIDNNQKKIRYSINRNKTHRKNNNESEKNDDCLFLCCVANSLKGSHLFGMWIVTSLSWKHHFWAAVLSIRLYEFFNNICFVIRFVTMKCLPCAAKQEILWLAVIFYAALSLRAYIVTHELGRLQKRL